MVTLETETRGTPDMSPLSPVVTPSPSPPPGPPPGVSEPPGGEVPEAEDGLGLAEVETHR